jgi:hypothetical protein
MAGNPPGAFNLKVVTGAEQVQLASGPTQAQGTSRQIANAPYDITPIAGTAYSPQIGDEQGAYLNFTSASAVTLTVAPDSTTNFQIGSVITFEQNGAGKVTVAAGAGVTINGVGTGTTAQYAIGVLVKKAPNTWTLGGSVS